MKKCLTQFTFITAMAAGMLAITQPAQAADSSATWTDPATGLTWSRCQVGQKWNGNTCEGKSIRLTLKEANEYIQKFINAKNFEGHHDWRLPTINELVSIRKCQNDEYDTRTERVKRVTEEGVKYVDETTIVGSKAGNFPYACSYKYKKTPHIDTNIFPISKEDLADKDEPFTLSSTLFAENNRRMWAMDYRFFGRTVLVDTEEPYEYRLTYYDVPVVRLVRGGTTPKVHKAKSVKKSVKKK